MNSPLIENAKVYRIGERVTLQPSGFVKRELVLEINTETLYPDFISIEAHKEKCSLFDNLTVGDLVEVDVNLRGRIWKDASGVEKVFNSLVAWKLKVIEKAPVVLIYPADDDDNSSPF